MKFYLPNTLKKNYICDFCGVECGCGFDPEAVPMVRLIISNNLIFTLRGLIRNKAEMFYGPERNPNVVYGSIQVSSDLLLILNPELESKYLSSSKIAMVSF